MPTLQLAANGAIGGVIKGNFGTYQPNTDGSYTVDTRDVASLLSIGFTYVTRETTSYSLAKAPLVATVGAVVASVALSNGNLTIAANPDVLRPVAVIVGTGTAAISAGNLAVTYLGNDGIVGTDNISLVCPASGTTTQFLSRGVDSISLAAVSAVAGGTSPFIELNTVAQVSLPVGPTAIDVAVIREFDAGATVAIGTLSSSVLASIAPTTAPNGTVTYSFVYSYVTPTA